MTLINVPVSASVDALVSGEVDAVTAWEPYIDEMIDRMDEKVVSWSVQEDQPSYSILMCRGDWAAENPGLISRFLKSLVQAENYMVNSPNEARSFIMKKLGYTEEYIESVWGEYEFSVSLDQSLVTAMEDEARWMISDNLTDKNTVPDFIDYIEEGPLKAIEPDTVNIIR